MVDVVLDRGPNCCFHTGEGQLSFPPCKMPVCFVALLAANGWLHVHVWLQISLWTELADPLLPILKSLISFTAATAF